MKKASIIAAITMLMFMTIVPSVFAQGYSSVQTASTIGAESATEVPTETTTPEVPIEAETPEVGTTCELFSLVGFVFYDVNGNGERDLGEQAFRDAAEAQSTEAAVSPVVEITRLSGQGGTPIDSPVLLTTPNGIFTFDYSHPQKGWYRIHVQDEALKALEYVFSGTGAEIVEFEVADGSCNGLAFTFPYTKKVAPTNELPSLESEVGVLQYQSWLPTIGGGQ